MAREGVGDTEYSCHGESLTPAGLRGPQLKCPALRKSSQSQQEDKNSSLVIPEHLNLDLCAAEFFPVPLAGRCGCLCCFTLEVYSPVTIRSA